MILTLSTVGREEQPNDIHEVSLSSLVFCEIPSRRRTPFREPNQWGNTKEETENNQPCLSETIVIFIKQEMIITLKKNRKHIRII